MLGKLFSAALVLLCSTAAASATTTYNFGSATTAVTPAKTFDASTAGGPGVAVKSNRVSNDTLTVAPIPSVVQGGSGLGIVAGTRDSSTIDGKRGNDLLELTFDSPVKILSASFTFAGVLPNSNDGFDFFADDDGDGSVAGDRIFAHMDIGAVGGTGTYDFVTDAFADIFSTTFAFAASWDQTVSYCKRQRDGVCKRWGKRMLFDSFKLKSLVVEQEPLRFANTIPSVPLPGALPLLATGLGLGGLLGWRRRRS